MDRRPNVKGVDVGEPKHRETDLFWSYSCTAEVNGTRLGLELVMSKKAPADAEFLVANISDEAGNPLWNFRDENPGKKDMCMLFSYHPKNEAPQLVIGMVRNEGMDKGGVWTFVQKLYKVIPLSQLLAVGMAQAAWTPRVLVDIKMAVARQNSLVFVLSDSERQLHRKIREFEEAERLRKEEARRLQRQKDREAILARDRVEAFTSDRQRVLGIPVTGDEWLRLPGGTRCIEVETDGTPVKAFVIDRKGRECVRKGLKDVGRYKPIREEAAITWIDVIMTSGPERIAHFPDETPKTVKSKGLNGGTMVALGKVDDDLVKVYQCKGDEVSCLGSFPTF